MESPERVAAGHDASDPASIHFTTTAFYRLTVCFPAGIDCLLGLAGGAGGLSEGPVFERMIVGWSKKLDQLMELGVEIGLEQD